MTRRIIAVVVCLLAGAADTADAANACLWSGSGGIFNAWSLPVNWVNCGNSVPQNGDTVVFNNSTVGTSVNDIQALTLKDIIINGTANESAGPTRWRLNGVVPLTVTGIVDVFSPPDRLGEGPAIDLPLRLSGAVVIHNVPFLSNVRATLRVGSIDLNGSSLSLAADAPIAVAGVISGAGEIRKDAPDSLTLAANTYAGITRIVQGTVVLQDSHALGSTGVGDYTRINANGRIVIAADGVVDEPLVIEGDSAGNTMVEVANGHAATLAGPINMQDNTGFLVRTNAQLSISGEIGPGLGAGLFKYGPGVLIISNPHSLWFRLRIDAGTVRVGAPGAFPPLAGIEFGSQTATFDLNNFDVTAWYVGTPIANNPMGGGIVQLGSGTLTLDGGSPPPSPARSSSTAGSWCRRSATRSRPRRPSRWMASGSSASTRQPSTSDRWPAPASSRSTVGRSWSAATMPPRRLLVSSPAPVCRRSARVR